MSQLVSPLNMHERTRGRRMTAFSCVPPQGCSLHASKHGMLGKKKKKKERRKKEKKEASAQMFMWCRVLKRILMDGCDLTTARPTQHLTALSRHEPLNYRLRLWPRFTSSKCRETTSGSANWRNYITSAPTDETAACWVRIFLAWRNNGISPLPPCVITR